MLLLEISPLDRIHRLHIVQLQFLLLQQLLGLCCCVTPARTHVNRLHFFILCLAIIIRFIPRQCRRRRQR
uniref:Putative secreted peptide n=1 Tax=Anopheles braziliensis TaxID=58242 RepID=A0A2M3ZVA7_9DIPT